MFASPKYTDKKEIKIFLCIKKFEREQLQCHIWEGLPNIWGNAQIFPHTYMRRPCELHMTLQLLHSEVPYIWGKFDFLFYPCTGHSNLTNLKSSFKEKRYRNLMPAFSVPQILFWPLLPRSGMCAIVTKKHDPCAGARALGDGGVCLTLRAHDRQTQCQIRGQHARWAHELNYAPNARKEPMDQIYIKTPNP